MAGVDPIQWRTPWKRQTPWEKPNPGPETPDPSKGGPIEHERPSRVQDRGSGMQVVMGSEASKLRLPLRS
jgi:hypothetical protein